MYEQTNELTHHGVLGMKWGVRRYQNIDGTLTEAGKARFKKVSDSKFRSWRDTRTAKKMLKQETRQFRSLGDKANEMAYDAQRKMKAGGKTLLLRKYKDIEAADDYRHYKKLATEYLERADIAKQKLNDVKSRKLKAGEDFIIQREFNLLTKDEKRRLIEKP